jgi:hypothetical protein
MIIMESTTCISYQHPLGIGSVVHERCQLCPFFLVGPIFGLNCFGPNLGLKFGE